MDYHAHRNRANAERSRAEGIVTRPIPMRPVEVPRDASPSRVMVSAFFAMAAERLAPFFQGRAVTMLDLGCGSGAAVLPWFERAGFRGRYIGLDIAAHKAFPAASSRGFTRELIVADVHTFNAAALPPIDLLVSATALEHIRDEAGALARLSEWLAPGAAQAHYVPGEAALPLYRQHGWRQYSPGCVRGLFPSAELYRAGGCCSIPFHLRTITGRAQPNTWRERHPWLYPRLRTLALWGDRLLGSQPATMYGALVMPRAGVAAAKAA